MRRYLGKLPRSTEELLEWHQKYISPVTLLIGFTLDAVIFRNVDLIASNIILGFHLCLAAVGIVVFHLIESGYLRGKVFLWLLPFVPSVIQFSFGALFGGFVILYSQSAEYATSWIFIVVLALLLIGNERFRQLYKQFAFQASVYFAVLMSFCVFFLPVLFLQAGTEMFLISEAAATGAFFLLLTFFGSFARDIVRAARPVLLRSIGSILLVFNVLYFTNSIPPIPFALREAGVYHNVVKTGDTYRLEAEPLEWYQKYLNYNTVYHRAPGERAYVFSAIYAPPRLAATIIHEWQHYEEGGEYWQTKNAVSFPILGGREGGYRGYSFIDRTETGKWRVNVKNGEGRLIGRVSFMVEAVAEKPEVVTLER